MLLPPKSRQGAFLCDWPFANLEQTSAAFLPSSCSLSRQRTEAGRGLFWSAGVHCPFGSALAPEIEDAGGDLVGIHGIGLRYQERFQ